MEKVKLHIDILAYPDKAKAKEEFGIIKNRTQNKNTIQEVEITELMEKIGQGYAISPSVMNGTKAINWLEQQLFMIDIDNKEDKTILSIKKALDICKANNILPAFYYFTYSSTKKIPRYRLAFIMEVPIKDIDTREKAINTLISLFPNSDKSCNTACTIFLGTNNPVIKYKLDSRIDTKYLLSLANMEIMEDKTNKKYSKDSELEQLKDNFPLLDLMVEDNGEYKDYGSYIQFKNCNICGHYDCLTYYKDYNTWYCFGASSCKGGSIIDYLMYRDNLSIKQAIDKLYELCHIERKKIKELDVTSAYELQKKELPPLVWYVKDLIPQGLIIVAGSPKVGKSWFVLYLALCVAKGIPFMGFNTKKSTCLYLALEDKERRLKDRANKILENKEAPKNLYYANSCSTIKTGLIDELEKYLSHYIDTKVIIIDVFQNVRDNNKVAYDYGNDYKELKILKNFADKKDLSIVVVHHTKKTGGDFKNKNDVFELISGTNGLLAVADTGLILWKDKRTDKQATLSMVTRETEDNEYIIEHDRETCQWKMLGTVEEYSNFIDKINYGNNTLVKTINKLVEETGNWKGTMQELNEEHKKMFGDLYRDTPHKVRSEVDKIKHFLLSNDNIAHLPPNNAVKGKRVHTFKKMNNNE